MLLYIALCLAAALAEVIGEPKPVWSPNFSMRIESFADDGYFSQTQVWVDKVKNRTRTDYLDGQEKVFYEHCDDEWHAEIVHKVFPITTEEHKNVQKCFLQGGFYSLQFRWTLYILVDMSDHHYIGREWMHGKDATKWKKIIRSDYSPEDYIEEIMWVYDREGDSVPLKKLVIDYNTDYKTRDVYFVNYYDYNVSEIDPEIWNIAKGMDCKIDAGSDIEKNLDFEEVSLFGNFRHYQRFFNEHKIMGQTHKQANKFTDLGVMQDVQVSASRQSKALPFPYTAGEVKRLSAKLPEQFDWRMYGAVTHDKSSYYYKPDYAFTAATVVEGALFLQTGRKIAMALSAQAIIDCSWGFGNRGVDGGSPEASFEWMLVHGLPTDAAYPFVGLNNNCDIDSVDAMAKVKAYYSVPSNDKDALKLALVNHGPVAILFDSENSEYEHGFFNDTDKCYSDPGTGKEHGVLVGYGLLDGEEYWIIKTTYRGYVLITTRDNTCGAMNAPLYVTLE